jgi:hypothetical protein
MDASSCLLPSFSKHTLSIEYSFHHVNLRTSIIGQKRQTNPEDWPLKQVTEGLKNLGCEWVEIE